MARGVWSEKRENRTEIDMGRGIGRQVFGGEEKKKLWPTTKVYDGELF